MKRCHLGDGVPYGLVDCSFTSLSPVNVCDWNSEHQRGYRGSQQFESVSEENHHCWLQLRECIRKAGQTDSNGLQIGQITAPLQFHVDLPIDLETFDLNFPCGQAEFRGQMHPRSNNLQLEVGIGGDGLQ